MDLGTIKRSDIFPNEAPIPEEELGKLRKAVRVILFDENKNIALNYYPAKEEFSGSYSLPGGGVDDDESISEALARESLEEAGCHLKNVKELGVIKEFGVGKNIKHNQETYCFVAEIDGEKMTPKFTEREIEDKLEVRWLPVGDAINFIQNQNLSFQKTRDLICLKKILGMSKTKAVVFDLGGVLFKEGKTVAIEKLAKEKGYDKEIVLKVLRSPESFDLRLGSISDGQFWNLVQQQLPEGYDALTIKKYWYEGYVLNEEVFELVKKLEGKYKLIIFSGNIKSRVEYLNQKYDFRKHFDLEIYSYDYRLNKYASNKPDPEFIKVLLEKSAVEPEEIFYIDDDQEMIELAKNFGINGFAYSGDIKKLEEKLKL